MSLLENYEFPKKDKDFINLLLVPRLENERKFFEKLWHRYKKFADRNFEIELGKHFHQRYWEMYLACALMDHNFTLQSKKSDWGPDIHILENDANIWIEATAPIAGIGKDAVPKQIIGKCNDVPHEKIILRYTSSIIDKNEIYKKYLNEGVISSGEPFIIAINGRRIPFSELEKEIPNIISAVLPYGDFFITINRDDRKIISKGYLFRPKIVKINNSAIPTCFFNDPISSGVSGILFSNSDIYNRPKKLGDDLLFIHNPMAINKLPLGWLKFGSEYWIEFDKLNWRQVK